MLNIFSNVVSRAREVQGTMSVKQFAAKLGMTQQTVDLYMKGARKPSIEFAYNICSSFGVSSDWLLGLPERGGGVTASGAASVAVGVGNAGPVTVNGTVNGPGRDCSACPLMAAHLETVRQLAAFQASTSKHKAK